MLLTLCDRFKALPDQVREQDASILRLIMIEKLGVPEKEVAPVD